MAGYVSFTTILYYLKLLNVNSGNQHDWYASLYASQEINFYKIIDYLLEAKEEIKVIP